MAGNMINRVFAKLTHLRKEREIYTWEREREREVWIVSVYVYVYVF